MRIWYNVKKFWSMCHGLDGGLVKSGPWRVIYPDSRMSRGLEYGYAKVLQELHGGTLSYIPDENVS